MDVTANAGLLAESVEQQQVKSVTVDSVQTAQAVSENQELTMRAVFMAPHVPRKGPQSKAEPDSAPNTTHSSSPSPSRKKGHSSSHKSKYKHSKAAQSSSDSYPSDTDNEPQIRKTHGGIKAWRYPGLQSTSSYRQLTTIGSCHQYTISGYALAKALGPGTCLRSDLFEAGGQKFQLEVFPAGLSADTQHHLSLFLTTPGSVNPNHVLYELAVVDQSGRGRHLTRASKPNTVQEPSHRLQTGVTAGYPCFVRTALLQQHQSRYLLNDSLVIRATVEVVRSWSAAPQQLAAPGRLHSPTHKQQQQLLLQQLPLPDAVCMQCCSPRPDYQDYPLYQQQRQAVVMASHGPQLQQCFNSLACMCPACSLGSPTGATGRAAAATVPTHSQLQQQHVAQPCSCQACLEAAAAAGVEVTRGDVNYLGSPVRQQPTGSATAGIAGECSCATCSAHKLLQLLPAIQNLQLPAGGTANLAAASAADSKQNEAACDAAIQHKELVAAGQPAAADEKGTELQPLVPDAAALSSVAGQLVEVLQQLVHQQQQPHVRQQASCCGCSTSINGAHSAAASCPVCAPLVGALQQQEPLPRVCSVAAAAGLTMYQARQQCVRRQHSFLPSPLPRYQQQGSPLSIPVQPQLQQQRQPMCQSPTALGQARREGSSHGSHCEGDSLQQFESVGLAVPLVKHHPTRVVYM